MLLIRSFSVCFLVMTGCTLVYAQSESDRAFDKTAKLIEQLADASFEARQEASEELVAIGSVAEKQLIAALSSDDPEVASRCRMILDKIYEGQAVDRRNAFVAGEVDQPGENVELWKEFEKITGNSDDSRKSFVDIQLSYGELLDLLEKNRAVCGEAINRLCKDRANTFGENGQESDRIFAVAIAFAGSQDTVDTPIAVCRGTGKLIHYGRLYGHDDQLIRSLLGAWVEHGKATSGNLRLLYAAAAYELEEAPALARKMLSDKNVRSTVVFNVLSKQGSIEDVDLIEPWIWDENSQKPRKYHNSEIMCSTGDRALAACVRLSGLKLKDFCFAEPKSVAGDIFGFENEKQRIEARNKWKEFRNKAAE